MTLSLGFSPCPNDTFIFDALVHGKIDTQGLRFEYVLEDVETLNQWAFEGRLQLTKLSYNSFLRTVSQYALMHSGSALGKGVGPLLIQKAGQVMPEMSQARIAIPGKNTTANLLFSLAYPKAVHKTEVLFSEIEAAVLKGDFDAGLVIHESRFTYAEKGLALIRDMGDWWEETAGAAIPLGGIVARRDLPVPLIRQVDKLIVESLQFSWKNYPDLAPFVRDHAQEMDERVMRQHIGLYVNEYSEDLGIEGEKAIQTLFQKAEEAGLIPAQERSIFY
ncbi:MAG: 1,4-dihydroxy-6-naphthoate synthase [Bacteroidetes bacterium]|nr:1,4-dihydroxy-6-naphthoate synthase [Bacteroidota bacterium]MBS1628553.1 1,4-dihydroxy-6-naphthoate synthase [Bacteroidota bacterium]